MSTKRVSAWLSLVGLASILVSPVLVSSPAEAKATSPVIVSLNLHTDRNVAWKTQRPQTRTAQLTGVPTLMSGIHLRWGNGAYSVDIGASPQHPLHRGTFTGVNLGLPGTEEHDLGVALEGYAFQGSGGTIEVLDLAADAAGVVTRFDILFDLTHNTPYDNAFGEIRMNEPEASKAVSPTAQQLHWPTVGVGNPAVLATDSFYNTSGAPVTFGTAVVAGGSARDFTIVADTCSGRTVAAASGCAITMAYRPESGGPRVSTLVVPAANQQFRIGLTGSAPLGTSRLTTTGADEINQGRRSTFSPLIAFGFGSFDNSDPGHLYRWVADPEAQQSHTNHYLGLRFDLADKTGPLRPGTYPTLRGSLDQGLDYTAFYRECIKLSGTETVNAFEVDADGQPTYASVNFTQTCISSTQSSAEFTGQLRYQVRSDRTAPDQPTRLSVAGRTVTWQNSRSRDLQTTIVRIETGTKVSPTTGYGLSAGLTKSATLPALRRGMTYQIAAFSIDRTGNISKATTKTFVY